MPAPIRSLLHQRLHVLLLVGCLYGHHGLYAQHDPLRESDSLFKLVAADTTVLKRLPGNTTATSGSAADVHSRAMACIARGHYLEGLGLFREAGLLLDSAIALLSPTNDERTLAFAVYEQGRCHILQSNVAGAIDRFEHALGIAARTGYAPLQSRAEYGIGHIYGELGDHPAAREHLGRALELATEPAWRYTYLSGIVEQELILGLSGPAERHLQEMTAIAERDTDISPTRLNLAEGEFHLVQGRYDQAIERFQQVVDDETRAGSIRGYPPWAMSRIAAAQRLAGRHAQAVAEARKGLAWCQRYGLSKEAQDNEEQLYLAYAAQGDKLNAYDHLQRFLAVKDSLNSPAVTGLLNSKVLHGDFARKLHADSLLRAEQEKRALVEHRAEVDRQRNVRNLSLVSGLGVLVLAGSLWGRLRYTRRSRAALQNEKDRSEALLLNILPEEVAEELKAKGEADAKQIDNVTVLFTDFKGFTAMSERLGPKELVRDIHECFSAFDRIMEQHGIEKIKTIGDAYMAAGGLPTPNATHAVDVVKAALEVRDFIAEGKALKTSKGLPFFEIRIGVHTGPVVAGIVGLRKFQYDIWGDTVNTASRMESSGEVGQVNISERTFALVKDAPGLTFTPRGKVQAKGKGELEMFFVHRSSEGA